MNTEKKERENEPALTPMQAKMLAAKESKKKLSKKTKSSGDNSLKTHTYRCSDDEYAELNKWAKELTEITNKKGRPINPSMIIRAVASMRSNLDESELIQAIKDNM
jgi:hypothetical protein